jgi:hypothetical protein
VRLRWRISSSVESDYLFELDLLWVYFLLKRKASPAQNNFLQRKAIPLLRTANKTEPRTKRHKLDFEKRICLKQAAKPAILGGDARAPKRQKPVDGKAGE